MHKKAVSLLALACLLSGCRPGVEAETPRDFVTAAAPAAPSAPAASAMASVMIDSVSYRIDRTIQYALFDLSKPLNKNSAIGGAIVSRLATGGEKGCCLALPRKWHPGMKFRVVWKEADRENILPQEYTRDLEIPPYDQVSDLYVVFYPDHDVEIVVSFGEPGHDQWRGRIKNRPWEQCVETSGRKPCFQALPKMFDTGSSQGYCTWAKRTSNEEALGQCRGLMIDCIKDFEDEPFCQGILWGHEKNERTIR